MKFISQLMCLIIFSTFSAQSYSAETFALMSEYGTQEAYEVEQALVAQAEVLTQENINKGVLEYKKGIKKILKRSDKRIGKLFLKKENIESLKNANLNINDKKILGKQIRVLLEKELKRDIASDTNLTSSFVKDFEHTLIKKSRSGFGRFMCHVGRVALGVVGVALILSLIHI